MLGEVVVRPRNPLRMLDHEDQRLIGPALDRRNRPRGAGPDDSAVPLRCRARVACGR